MKKLYVTVFLCILFFSHPFDLLAKDICLKDTAGDYFVLSGGKIDKKPFAGKIVSQLCHGTITGSIVTIAPNVESITIEGNAPAPCGNFMLLEYTDTSLDGWSRVDFGEDGGFDGNLYLTHVSCDSVQGAMPILSGPDGASSFESLITEKGKR